MNLLVGAVVARFQSPAFAFGRVAGRGPLAAEFDALARRVAAALA